VSNGDRVWDSCFQCSFREVQDHLFYLLTTQTQMSTGWLVQDCIAPVASCFSRQLVSLWHPIPILCCLPSLSCHITRAQTGVLTAFRQHPSKISSLSPVPLPPIMQQCLRLTCSFHRLGYSCRELLLFSKDPRSDSPYFPLRPQDFISQDFT
jgi:hypothetical protein